MSISLNIFNVDEKIVINQTTNNENLSAYTKNNLLTKLDFILTISSDEDTLNLYQGLKNKLSSITDDEWYYIRDLLPFEVPYSENDTSDFSGDIEIAIDTP